MLTFLTALILVLTICFITLATVSFLENDKMFIWLGIIFTSMAVLSFNAALLCSSFLDETTEENHQTIQAVVKKVEPFNDQLIFYFEDQRILALSPNDNLNLIANQLYEITYNPQKGNQIIEINPVSKSETTTPFIQLK